MSRTYGKKLNERETFFVDQYIFGDGNAGFGGDDRSNGDIAELRKLPYRDGKLAADLCWSHSFHVFWTT